MSLSWSDLAHEFERQERANKRLAIENGLYLTFIIAAFVYTGCIWFVLPAVLFAPLVVLACRLALECRDSATACRQWSLRLFSEAD